MLCSKKKKSNDVIPLSTFVAVSAVSSVILQLEVEAAEPSGYSQEGLSNKVSRKDVSRISSTRVKSYNNSIDVYGYTGIRFKLDFDSKNKK